MLPNTVRRSFGPAWQARAFGVLLAIVPAIMLAGLVGIASVDGPNKDGGADVVQADGTRADGTNADGTPASDGPGGDGQGGALNPDGTPVDGGSGGLGGTDPLGGPSLPGGAGGTDTTLPAGGATTTIAGQKVVLRATDQGVTKDSIKLGVLIANTSELAAGGFKVGVSGDIRKIATAWANHTNKNGGILGRKVNVVFDTFSVLDVNDMIRACKKMTEDEKVFSIINLGGYDSIAQLCVAKDHKVPLFAGDPQPQGWYKDAAPYLWTSLMSKDRMHRNDVRFLKELGTIKDGNQIGVLYHNIPNVAPAIEQSMLPEFAAQGLTPKKVIKLAEDSNQALNQIPQAVVDMRAAGVTQVFLMTNLIFKTSFIQQADKQAYRPAYFDNDHYFGCYDFTTTTYPNTYDGATCVTATNSGQFGPQNFDNPAFNRAFVKLADTVYSETFTAGYSDGGGDQASGQEAQRGLTLAFGTFYLMWSEAAQRVGPELTRPKWGVEMGRTGAWDRSVTTNKMTYSATKHDGPDTIAVVRWFAGASDGFEAKKFHRVVAIRPAFY